MNTLRSLNRASPHSHHAKPRNVGLLFSGAVLIAGGVITVSAACFFGVPNFRFHLLQVTVLSFLIALVLVAIADIDRPYQGDVKVSPDGFEFAIQTFNSGDQ